MNLATERASVLLEDTGHIDSVVAVLADSGYPASDATLELAVEGMSCASCVGRVEKVILAVPGVHRATVNLATGRAAVGYTDGAVEPVGIARVITDAGYPASVITAPAETRVRAESTRADELQDLHRALVWAAALTLPVFLLEMGSHVVPGVRELVANTIGTRGSAIVQFVLTTLVLAGPGRRFLTKGFPSLAKGRRT